MPTDLDRAVAPEGWVLERVARTASTNADLVERAEQGAPAGLVLVAEHQTEGRGRLDRVWEAPPGSGLTFSVLLRPEVPAARLGWLPLLTGLAVTEAVREVAGLRTRVKWPNDVLVVSQAGERKLAGVLAERRGDAVVVGVGLNVGLAAADLPVPTATSLLVERARTTDRSEVLTVVLEVLAARYDAWVGAEGDADACGLRPAYVVGCATVGRSVRVELPGRTVEGEAVGIDPAGCLRVNDLTDGSSHELAAGDVVHVR